MLLVVVLFAALVYGLVRIIQRRNPLGGARPPKDKPRYVAPDDDEDFLRSLEEKDREDQDRDDPENPRPG